MKKTKINFYSQGTSFNVKSKIPLKKWIKFTISNEGKEAEEINVIFCDDEHLFNLNKEYLNHNTLTDIITFDYTENSILSGEIFISIDRVRENALKFSSDFYMELRRVIIHGVLHLCGYKDKSKGDKLEMTSKEDFYLDHYVLCKSNL